MDDYIVSAFVCGQSVRVYAASTGLLVEKARSAHNASFAASAALGRLLTATVLMGSMLKNDETVTCQIKCDGGIGGLCAVADANGNVKGSVHNPNIHFPNLCDENTAVVNAIGNGTLRVTKDLRLKEPYTGQIELVASNIATDIAYYYTASEQIATDLLLGVLHEGDSVLSAGGIIIQLMPFASVGTPDKIVSRISEIDSFAHLFLEKSVEQILEQIFAGMDLKIMSKTPAMFKCGCNRSELKQVVMALGEEEIKDIISKEKKVDIKCPYCGTVYSFTESELNAILSKMSVNHMRS